MGLFISLVVAGVSLFVFAQIVKLYVKDTVSLKEVPKKEQLLFTGFMANVCDTLGIGSFAVIVAFNNRWKMIDDKQLPGTLNAQGVLAAMMQALLFLYVVEVDIFLLASFVGASCLGAFCSSFVVSKLNKQTIRLLMALGFFVISFLILARQLDMLPLAGDAVSCSQFQLLFGLPAMFLIGMLPSIGMGIYVPIQVAMFLLGFSPLVAFPVMTTAGSLVQATTAYVFAVNAEVSVKESLLMGFAGVVGVAATVPFVAYFNLTTLRWLLLFIVLYNAFTIWQAYQRDRVALAPTA